MIDWLGPVIYESYASSETGYITVMAPQDALRKPGSAGKVVGQARIRILDDAGNDLPTGGIGRIYAHQPAYSDFSYHGNDAARREVERDGLATMLQAQAAQVQVNGNERHTQQGARKCQHDGLG